MLEKGQATMDERLSEMITKMVQELSASLGIEEKALMEYLNPEEAIQSVGSILKPAYEEPSRNTLGRVIRNRFLRDFLRSIKDRFIFREGDAVLVAAENQLENVNHKNSLEDNLEGNEAETSFEALVVYARIIAILSEMYAPAFSLQSLRRNLFTVAGEAFLDEGIDVHNMATDFLKKLTTSQRIKLQKIEIERHDAQAQKKALESAFPIGKTIEQIALNMRLLLAANAGNIGAMVKILQENHEEDDRPGKLNDILLIVGQDYTKIFDLLLGLEDGKIPLKKRAGAIS